MVQRAADRADGLQWRRALASVATEELGIGLGEALGHPVVAKAQALVGAPSYEESLAAIVEATPTGGTETPAAPATEAVADAEPRAHADAEPATGDDLPVRVAVVHLDGLSELDEDEELELRFTEDGLDVLRAPDEAALAHFAWSEIHGVEVQPGRARMLRRRGSSTRLILSATGRHARFEARGADPEELKQRLAPALTKLGAGR
jgi:hypothetical protein